jgi:hypothetical protein
MGIVESKRRWWQFSLLAALLALATAIAGQERQPRSVEASHVTLQGPISLSDALKTLAKSGNRVEDLRRRYEANPPNPILQLDLKQSPFWQATEAVAREAKLIVRPALDPTTHQSLIGLMSPPGETQPQLRVAWDGPFRLLIRRITADRHLDDDSLSGLSIVTELMWEPRYQPLLLKMDARSVAVASAGGQMSAVSQAGSGGIRLAGEPAVEIPLRLPLPPRSDKAIKKLEAHFCILTPPGQLDFHLPRLAVGERQTRGGVTLRIDRVETDARTGVWTVAATLDYAGALDLESHQTWAVDGNTMALVSNRDKSRIPATANRYVSIEDGGAIHVTHYFKGAPGKVEEYAVEYQAPAAPVAYSAKFAFAELPLP